METELGRAGTTDQGVHDTTLPWTAPGNRWHAWTEGLAEVPFVQRATNRFGPLADKVAPEGPRRDALRGRWLGHALHPLLTDLPLGCWNAALLLDLTTGRHANKAAERLVLLGVVLSVPAAVTGVAEWADADLDTQRVGTVHAALNGAALGLFTASWWQRRRGRQLAGVALGLAGGAVASVSGYLGGHLSFSRGMGVESVGAAVADTHLPSARRTRGRD